MLERGRAGENKRSIDICEQLQRLNLVDSNVCKRTKAAFYRLDREIHLEVSDSSVVESSPQGLLVLKLPTQAIIKRVSADNCA